MPSLGLVVFGESRAGVESPAELAYSQQQRESWNNDSFVDRDDRFVPINWELDMRDGSDSDSSIDLHTPLPHLMF